MRYIKTVCAGRTKRLSINQMTAGPVMDFFLLPTFQIYVLCAVKLKVLGLKAYWYTGSTFHQLPQSYLTSKI